jgi:hypothetical protein
MSTVYRHYTLRCEMQSFVNCCCFHITTSPNSVEKPWTELCLDSSIPASYSVLVFNSISQFKTKPFEGLWDKCNVKAATIIMRSKDSPSVEINWESKYWREQTDSRKCCYMGLEQTTFWGALQYLLLSKLYSAAQELTIMHSEWVRRKGEYSWEWQCRSLWEKNFTGLSI